MHTTQLNDDRDARIPEDLPFFVLNLGLDVINGVWRFDLKSDGLPSWGLDEDLNATTQMENQEEHGLLLDIIIQEGSQWKWAVAGQMEFCIHKVIMISTQAAQMVIAR